MTSTISPASGNRSDPLATLSLGDHDPWQFFKSPSTSSQHTRSNPTVDTDGHPSRSNSRHHSSHIKPSTSTGNNNTTNNHNNITRNNTNAISHHEHTNSSPSRIRETNTPRNLIGSQRVFSESAESISESLGSIVEDPTSIESNTTRDGLPLPPTTALPLRYPQSTTGPCAFSTSSEQPELSALVSNTSSQNRYLTGDRALLKSSTTPAHHLPQDALDQPCGLPVDFALFCPSSQHILVSQSDSSITLEIKPHPNYAQDSHDPMTPSHANSSKRNYDTCSVVESIPGEKMDSGAVSSRLSSTASVRKPKRFVPDPVLDGRLGASKQQKLRMSTLDTKKRSVELEAVIALSTAVPPADIYSPTTFSPSVSMIKRDNLSSVQNNSEGPCYYLPPSRETFQGNSTLDPMPSLAKAKTRERDSPLSRTSPESIISSSTRPMDQHQHQPNTHSLSSLPEDRPNVETNRTGLLYSTSISMSSPPQHQQKLSQSLLGLDSHNDEYDGFSFFSPTNHYQASESPETQHNFLPNHSLGMLSALDNDDGHETSISDKTANWVMEGWSLNTDFDHLAVIPLDTTPQWKYEDFKSILFLDFLTEHFTPNSIAKFFDANIESFVVEGEDMPCVVELTSGANVSISIRANFFTQRSSDILQQWHQHLLNDKTDIQLRWCTPIAVNPDNQHDMDHMVRATKEYIAEICNDPIYLDWRRPKISKQIHNIVHQYWKKSESPMVQRALAIYAMEFAIKNHLCLTKQSIINLSHTQLVPQQRWVTSRMLSRQIKATINDLMMEEMEALFADFARVLEEPTTDMWAPLVASFLALCIFMEELESRADDFIVSQNEVSLRNKTAPILKRDQVLDLCKAINDVPFGKFTKWLHKAYHSYGEEGDDALSQLDEHILPSLAIPDTSQFGARNNSSGSNTSRKTFNPLATVPVYGAAWDQSGTEEPAYDTTATSSPDRIGHKNSTLDEPATQLVESLGEMMEDPRWRLRDLAMDPLLPNHEPHPFPRNVSFSYIGRLTAKFLLSFRDKSIISLNPVR